MAFANDHAQAWEWYREEAVGRALKLVAGASSCDATEEHGGETCNPDANPTPRLSREDLFVTTKIHPRDFAPDRLRELFDISRSNLNVSDSFWAAARLNAGLVELANLPRQSHCVSFAMCLFCSATDLFCSATDLCGNFNL